METQREAASCVLVLKEESAALWGRDTSLLIGSLVRLLLLSTYLGVTP